MFERLRKKFKKLALYGVKGRYQFFKFAFPDAVLKSHNRSSKKAIVQQSVIIP
jgi:hypothetical protein